MSRTGISLGRALRAGRGRAALGARAALIGVPLLLAGSLGLRADAAHLVDTVAAGSGAPAWMNGATGPVEDGVGPAAPAADQLPAPDEQVIVVNGDPQTLAAGAAGGNPVDQSVPAPGPGDTAAVSTYVSTGIPVRTLQAYVTAARTMAGALPNCHLHWSLLAAIGRVESNHGRFGGATVTATGLVTPRILGPLLNGRNNLPLIRDTDRGALDGDATVERAVGPMQFLPGTWSTIGADADGDGTADPQDVDDAALSAGRYLCLGGTDLGTQAGRWNAVLRYNHSSSYGALVIALADSYATGRTTAIPSVPAGLTPPVNALPATVPAAPPVPAAPVAGVTTRTVPPVVSSLTTGTVTPVAGSPATGPTTAPPSAVTSTTSSTTTTSTVTLTVTATVPGTAGSATTESTTAPPATSTTTTAAGAPTTSTATSSTAPATSTTTPPGTTAPPASTTTSAITTASPATATTSADARVAAAVSTPQGPTTATMTSVTPSVGP